MIVVDLKKMNKTPKQLERHLKGLANHRRLEILDLISRNNGISVDQIADSLKCNVKTISEHIRRLVVAGLVNKKYRGRTVEHTLSPYGERFHDFLSNFK